MLDLENQSPFSFRPGKSPILVSFPHNGSFIPEAIAAAMTEDGRSSRDTDWFLDRLYDFDALANASLLVAEFSRYVIDLNRPSNNRSLYPGQTTTGLIPDTCFDGAAIYQGGLPSTIEMDERIKKIWTPYHAKIKSELSRIKNEHGLAVLIEAHSIKSVVPRLFDGVLPDFNIGTNNDCSCQPELTHAIMNCLKNQTDYSFVCNGRFIGGFITREYGQPTDGVHALQIELSQATYLNENDLSWAPAKAGLVQNVFQQIIQTVVRWIQQQ